MVAASVTEADEPQLLPQTGILVLRTGRVLRGDIVRVGDRYVVAVGEHDEVGVPVDAVEMQCASLQEAYARQRNQLPTNSKVADHLKLADWCLQYDLLGCAAEQLMAAQRCDPSDPHNVVFEKRLRLAAQQSVSSSAPATRTAKIVVPPDLDKMTRSLPSGTVERFTNTVQPILINRCGASNCHGPNSHASFRLTFPSWRRTLPRRYTQRNLQSALALLDQGDPRRSPLLVMATQAHGDAKTPPLTDDNVTQLNHLAEWIYHSLGSQTPDPPAALNSPDALLLQPGHRASSESAAAKKTPAVASRNPGPAAPRSDHPSAAQPSASDTSDIPPPPVSGNDPFDPEVFNRRYARPQR